MKLDNIKRTVFDKLGFRQKKYERAEAGRTVLAGVPVIARLDGKAFHTFTRGLMRPFDTRLQHCMQQTMLYVADAFDADLAYTQSDEITLVWFNSDVLKEFIFAGKYQKLVSLTAAAASVKFASLLHKWLPEKAGQLPVFDSRVWQVPNVDSVIENLIWRQDDATRNSVTMASQAHYSHRELHGRGQKEMLKMLKEKDIVWEDYNPHFKHGIFAKRFDYEAPLSDEALAKIPEQHRPTGLVLRSKYFLFESGTIRSFDEVDLSMIFSDAVMSTWGAKAFGVMVID